MKNNKNLKLLIITIVIGAAILSATIISKGEYLEGVLRMRRSVKVQPILAIAPVKIEENSIEEFFSMKEEKSRIEFQLNSKSKSDQIPLETKEKIYGLSISAIAELPQSTSMVRIVLHTDKNGEDKQFLVYEGSRLTEESSIVSIKNRCEESCILNGVIPTYLEIQTENEGEIRIGDIYKNTEASKKSKTTLAKKQIEYKIASMNQKIRDKEWTAGKTPVCEMTYDEKRKLFQGGKVPNLQGFDCYAGGVFTIGELSQNEETSTKGGGEDAEFPPITYNF